ncbi:hypothetical protein GCM10009681_02970 [Luedemannella helvata]|uniref:Spheroidene monooxygenase n=1 Tax=Luedemannella helvata TaxID=349315 RepID=A0ABN2JR58_9ACTN
MPLVTMHIWRVPPVRVGAALWRVARDRGRVRALPGCAFAKVLGTGRGFGPGGADATRWAVLSAWHSPAAAADFEAGTVASAWRRIATAECRLDLAPLSGRGTWAGRRPFEPDPGAAPDRGIVVALTRARLRPARALRFWRAIGPVADAVARADGLHATFGVGEAPIGWQGTVSVWRDAAALRAFAYRNPAHTSAIAATPAERWYAEELFARFALLDVAGDRSVIGWAAA